MAQIGNGLICFGRQEESTRYEWVEYLKFHFFSIPGLTVTRLWKLKRPLVVSRCQALVENCKYCRQAFWNCYWICISSVLKNLRKQKYYLSVTYTEVRKKCIKTSFLNFFKTVEQKQFSFSFWKFVHISIFDQIFVTMEAYLIEILDDIQRFLNVKVAK